MAQRFTNPFEHWVNSAGVPYAGGFLYFYESGTSTPLDTYNDPDLAAPHANSNPITLNSAGRPSVAIYLKNQLYTVVLKDSSLNTIWTADNVATTDFAAVVITKTGSGSPSGVVAGTAGSSGVLATQYWDYTNAILYVCTTTGSTSTAVWTAINASAATPTVASPQGYLTPTSATPVIAGDVTAATAIYYTPFVGNLIPIYNGSRMVPTEFTELTLTLASQHALSTFYDVFVFSNAGVLTLVTGPAWSTMTAGAGARGTGAGTTQLTRLNGYWVNAVSMTGRNGSTTYTVAANLGTYVGSIFVDGTAGQVTCHRAYGQSRKWGVWNAYNRQRIALQLGDATGSWVYSTNTIRQSRADATNVATVFAGLPEEMFAVRAQQGVQLDTNNGSAAIIGVGVNSTTAISGKRGFLNGMTVAPSPIADITAEHVVMPAIGIQNINFLESGNGTTQTTFRGGSTTMRLVAEWRG